MQRVVVAQLLAPAVLVAEVRARRPPRLLRRHTIFDIAPRLHLEMEFHLFVEVGQIVEAAQTTPPRTQPPHHAVVPSSRFTASDSRSQLRRSMASCARP